MVHSHHPLFPRLDKPVFRPRLMYDLISLYFDTFLNTRVYTPAKLPVGTYVYSGYNLSMVAKQRRHSIMCWL